MINQGQKQMGSHDEEIDIQKYGRGHTVKKGLVTEAKNNKAHLPGAAMATNQQINSLSYLETFL